MTFIYTDELNPESAEEAQHLLAAADHFGLHRLVSIAAAKLSTAMQVGNVADTLLLAEQHGVWDLKDAALRFVARNAAGVLATPGWAHLAAARPALMGDVVHTLAHGGTPPPRPAASAPAPAAAAAAATNKKGKGGR